MGQKAANIEAHPERRYKAALEAYIEAELPVIKKEVRPIFSFYRRATTGPEKRRLNLFYCFVQQPGLRLQQYKERLFKQFQKHPGSSFLSFYALFSFDN